VSGQAGTVSRSTAEWRGRWLVELLAVFVAYYIAGKLGQATTEIRSTGIGPVWPAYGVALASVLLCGPRIWPALAASAFVVAFQNPVPLAAVVVQAASATLAALGGGIALKQAGFDRGFPRLRDALNLIVLGAAGSAMVSSVLGTAALYATGVQPYAGILSAWLIYWLGDATGVLLVTPMLLTAHEFVRPTGWAYRAECVVMYAVLALVSVLIFSDLPLFSVRLHVLAFAVLPMILWAAVRFGMFRVSVATVIVATIATVATALGDGPFAQNDLFTNAVLLDVFFIILSVTGLMLAALVAERAHAQAEHERLATEQAAMEARLRLAAIVESSEDAIIGLNLDGTIDAWNAAATVLYGYNSWETLGRDFFELVRPQSAGVAEQPDSITRRDDVHTRKDGSKVAVALVLSPIHDAKGGRTGESVIVRDVSDRLRANALRDELAHLGRVSMLSVLTGALAHEINQPLTGISLNAEAAELLLASQPLQLQTLRDILREIRADNQRAGDVIQRIRSLLKKEAVCFEPVDINATVTDVVKLVNGTALRRGIRIDLSMAQDARPVRGDRVQVQQVLLNLLMNACDAVEHNAPQLRRVGLRTNPTADGMAVLVKDLGTGLSDEEMARMFEPFYTTKSDGMGLGLSICHAIVAAHDGTLDASRNPDRGMTFAVTFPYLQK
jgi:PAS domain S-box-containing protein